MFRLPEVQVFATYAFDSFDQGFEASGELLTLGIRPTLLDLTEESDGIRLYLVFEGYREGVAAQEKRTRQVCIDFGGRDIGSETSVKYWAERHQSGENYKRTALGQPREVRWNQRRGRSFGSLHIALPISRVLEYRRRCEEIMSGSGVKVVEYSIWSRPELFSMRVVPEHGVDASFRDNLAVVMEQVLILAQDMGGVMEYCHGVGVKLNHLLAGRFGWAMMYSVPLNNPWTRPTS